MDPTDDGHTMNPGFPLDAVIVQEGDGTVIVGGVGLKVPDQRFSRIAGADNHRAPGRRADDREPLPKPSNRKTYSGKESGAQ